MISSSLTVVYSAVAGVVPRVKRRDRRAQFSKMEMHVYLVRVLVWVRKYSASRSVFLVRMLLDGNFIIMSEIMWIILRRQNP